MIYIRIIFIIFIILYLLYYAMIIGQLFNLWKITDEEIEFDKLLIPFYYWFKLK